MHEKTFWAHGHAPLREIIIIFVGADGCPPGKFADSFRTLSSLPAQVSVSEVVKVHQVGGGNVLDVSEHRK